MAATRAKTLTYQEAVGLLFEAESHLAKAVTQLAHLSGVSPDFLETAAKTVRSAAKEISRLHEIEREREATHAGEH